MNANLDITDDLRDFSSFVQHSKFYMQQALSRKYCRLLSQSRQSLGFLRCKKYLACRADKNKILPTWRDERALRCLRRDDFAHLFGEIIAHDVFGRINKHLAAVADPQDQPLGVFQRRVAKGEMVNFINFLAT